MPFHHSTFGCLSQPAICIDTLLCPCCQVGRQCHALKNEKDDMSCFWCLVSIVTFPIMPMCLRCRVSDKFGLGEFVGKSVVCGLLCAPCSLCMTNRELNHRGVNPGGCCCS